MADRQRIKLGRNSKVGIGITYRCYKAFLVYFYPIQTVPEIWSINF